MRDSCGDKPYRFICIKKASAAALAFFDVTGPVLFGAYCPSPERRVISTKALVAGEAWRRERSATPRVR